MEKIIKTINVLSLKIEGIEKSIYKISETLISLSALTPKNFIEEYKDGLIGLLGVILGSLIGYCLNKKINEDLRVDRLRPIILREGFLVGWKSIGKIINNKIEGRALQFVVLKNVAHDISGYIIIDGYKYSLAFGHKISIVKDEAVKKMIFELTWGWLNQNQKIKAALSPKNKEKTKEENKIFIKYKDSEGNQYYTVESKDFSQKSKKIKNNI